MVLAGPLLLSPRAAQQGLGSAGRPQLSYRGALQRRCSAELPLVPPPSEDVQPRRRIPALLASALGGAACALLGAPRSRAAAARAKTVLVDLEAGKEQRLLEDEEVRLLRELQARFVLFDTRRKAFVGLPELLRPGGALYAADVVCIGELHDAEADHVTQRLLLDAIIYVFFLELRRSDGIDPNAPQGRTAQNQSPQRVALGLEYFSRQQQPVLDDFIFGGTPKGVQDFRTACDWDNVWSYDWALHAPLFRFCQLNLTRIVGLNLPYEAAKIVSEGGLEALPSWFRATLPDVDLTQTAHRLRFEAMLKMPMETAIPSATADLAENTRSPNPALDKIYQAQVLWDEYMADTAVRYLDANGGRFVLFAGAAHAWRDAIPDRVERQARTAGRRLKAVSIVPWHGGEGTAGDLAGFPKGADFLLPMAGPGGGDELVAAAEAQRERLRGKPRVFPAGFL
mmetsp:Transcript_20265/g.51778  ORF Transcript_20265/g.51778 Transcript_20265/m.51778 type:complete len:454 (+) Transcript_20265:61-1422(+)